MTAAGESDTDEMFAVPGAGGVSASAAEALFAEVAVMVTVTGEPTGVVVTVNVPDVAPCGITMDAGTVAAGLSVPRLTRTPPTPAGAESCTVPVAGDPLTTEAGETESDAMFAVPAGEAVKVSDAVVELADVAVIMAVVCEPTAEVETVNVPEEAPCGIVIEAGTVAEALLEPRLTRTPPAPAGAAS